MSRKYFGTDGIRGRVGEGAISADFVLRLGNAYGHSLRARGGDWRRPQVLIGKDTRISNYMFEAALEAGLVAAGVDVQLMGPMPTPAVAHLQEPAAGATVEREFRVFGWAVKDGVGVREVRLTLDGEVVATADYGQENRWVGEFLQGRSNDPGQPAVAFSAQVDASALPAGDYWLGMEIEGADGSVETWSERRIRLR